MQPIIRVPLPDVPEKCGDCGQASEMWPLAVYGGRLNVTCPYCFAIVAPVVAVRLDAAPGHGVISLDGWTCDICSQPVNGQTDPDGVPLNAGDSVRHVAPVKDN